MQPTPDTVPLTVCLPRALYDTFAEFCEGDVAERVAALVAQAATFGNPADLYQDLEATTGELAALSAQVAAVALLLVDGAPAHPLQG